MPVVFDPSKPYQTVVDKEFAAFTAPKTPAPATKPAAPVFDPNQPYEVVPETKPTAPTGGAPQFNPDADFEKIYSLDEVKAKPEKELDEDKAFHPVEFGLQNQQALQSDPATLEKVLNIYRARETRGTTLVEKGEALVKGTPKVAKTIGKGVVTTAKQLINLSPPALLARAAGAATVPGGLDIESKRVAGEVAEIPASIESAGAGSGELLRRGGREIKEGTAGLFGGGKAAMTPQEWRNRFFMDLAGLEQSQKAGQGNGAVLQALGNDAETLKQSGIELRPEVIQELSVVTDPINWIPIGGAVAGVTKIGGRLATRVVAQAVNPEQAAKLANLLNQAREVVTVGREAAGKGVQAVGAGVEKTGQAVQKVGETLAGPASLATILGGDITKGLGVGAAVRLTPKVVEKTGQAIKATGEILEGTRPVPGALRAAGQIAGQGAIGVGEGLLLSLPFELGARPEEEEHVLGAAGVAGGVRAGLKTAKIAGTKAQDVLASQIFKQIEQTEAPPSATYGTEPALDTANQAASAALPPNSQKLLNWTRELFRDSGVEVYSLDNKTFENQAGTGNAHGFAVKIGEKISPDGTVTPVLRVLLNADTEALPHELFHALTDLDPQGAKGLIDSVLESWTPEQKKTFSDIYNTARNGGRPEAAWTTRLTDEAIGREAGAEVFSRLYLGQDLSGVAPNIKQKASLFLSGILEKLGVPLGKVGAERGQPGVSTLGVRPGVEPTRIGQEWLQNLLTRIREQGNILPEESITSPLAGGEIVPGEISRRPVAQVPTTPTAPVPQPVPKVTPPAPVPTPARNIRVTREQQNDFAARRAADLGIDRARAAASTPEATARVNEVSASMEAGNPVLEIDHRGVIAAGTEKAPSGRTVRRAEQEAAYIAEGLGAAPESVRDRHQKTFVPVRWEIVNGKPQLLAMSLDKVIANVSRAVKDIVAAKQQAKLPYEVDATTGKLTEAAWENVVSDLQSYTENQANGYRGDGKKLVRPTEDLQQSLPPENPGYNPTVLPEDKTNFLNLIQGLSPALTSREVQGRVPGAVKGAAIARAQGREPQVPSVIRPQDITKQVYKSGERILETNPLRNELAAAGVPVRELIEVTERINAGDILNIKQRPDLQFKAPVTDIIRGGFLPKEEPLTGGAAFAKFFQKTEQQAGGGSKIQDVKEVLIKPTEGLEPELEAYAKYGSNFQKHIASSVPGLVDARLRILKGLSDPNLFPGKRVEYFDLGSSEGYFPKAWTDLAQQRGVDAHSISIDPLPEFKDAFEKKTPQVPNADFELAAWREGFHDPTANMDIPAFDPKGKKFDIVHEGLTFQFFTPERAENLKAVKDIMTPDGVFVAFEKFKNPDYAAREVAKNEFKSKFFTKEQIAAKNKEVLQKSEEQAVGMEAYQVPRTEFEKVLKDNWKHVEQVWSSGNFAGYIASDSPTTIAKLRDSIGDTNSEFSYEKTPRAVTGEGQFLPKDQPVEKVAEQLKGLDTTGLKEKFKEWGTSLTQAAYDVGRNVKSQADVSTLRALREEASAVARAAIKAGDFDAATPAAAKAQFWQEAIEAATGEGGKLNLIRGALKEPEFKPPFPTEGVEFLPRRQELIPDYFTMPGREPISSMSADLIRARGVTPKFWLNAKTGEVLLAPDGHEEAGLSVLKDFKERKDIDSVYQEMNRRGWVRGVADGSQVQPIQLNGPLELRPRARQTMEDIAFSSNRKVEFNNDTLIEKPNTPEADFLPSQDPRAVASAAVQDADGKIFRGRYHGAAIDAALSGNAKKIEGYSDPSWDVAFKVGFVTNNGEFLSRDDAFARGKELAQLPPDFEPKPVVGGPEGEIHTRDFRDVGAFLPKQEDLDPVKSGERDGQTFNWDGSVFVPPPQKKLDVVTLASQNVPLAGLSSQQVSDFATPYAALKENPDIKIGAFKLSGEGEPKASIDLNIVVDQKHRENTAQFARDNGQQAFFDLSKFENVDTGGSGETVLSKPEALKVAAEHLVQGKPVDVEKLKREYLPEVEQTFKGFEPLSPEQRAKVMTKRKVNRTRESNPEAILPKYAREEDGSLSLTAEGKPRPVTLEYELASTPLAKEAAKGKRGAERESAIADALGKELVGAYRQAKKDKDILAGSTWYSTARVRLRKLFGDDAKFFAELLGATSARTPVETNFRFALDAYNRFKSGEYDAILAKYREGKSLWDAGDIQDFVKATKNEDPTRGQFLDWWVDKNDLAPVQSNGKKFGANSRAVLRVLDGSWQAEVKGPKTPNFAGNLTGQTFEATIDVWAARALHRLANKDNAGRWRILPENETGVSDADFYLGQAAFRNAAEKLGIKPDALQAVLWFAEKKHWEDRGWTRGAGAERSDFNTLLSETEKTPEGLFQKKKTQKELGLE